MADGHDLTTRSPKNSSSTADDRHETAEFECNICFDLAQEPVITLCGHLHCWPCLYKWLKLHSQSHECPVCKALIEEEKLIPLYGRGKATTDPRFISLQNAEIPHRPAGQRPETAPPPPPEANNLPDREFGRLGGVIPTAPAAFSHFGMSAGFGGVLSPVFSVRFHEFSDATGYGGSLGFNYGSLGEGGVLDRESSVVVQRNDNNLKKILVFILLCVLFDFLAI